MPPASRPDTAAPWDHPLSRPCPAPFLRAPETSRGIFTVMMAAAMAPLLAGVVFFGYRAALVASLSIGACALLERAYYRITRTPALMGRSHALLTGTLLALTLPPFAPWYVPLVAAAFAIILGKAIFGGTGHFLWQPALVGRLAVAAMFGMSLNPATWPVLSMASIITGDVTSQTCQPPASYRGWDATGAPAKHEGFLLPLPTRQLHSLSNAEDPKYASISAAILDLPPLKDLICGARPGAIGETSVVVLLMAGLYLIYRNYVKWVLPVSFVLSAAAVVAVAPVFLTGGDTLWFPICAQGWDVGVTYVAYHLLGGELLLAAFFLAPEMTSRPVTSSGQVLFGIGCGLVGMLIRLYMPLMLLPLACFVAVLVMNTFTPLLERRGGTKRRLKDG